MNYRKQIALNTEMLDDNQAETLARLMYHSTPDTFKAVAGVLSMLDEVQIIELLNTEEECKYIANTVKIDRIKDGWVRGTSNFSKHDDGRRYIKIDGGFFYHPSILSILRCL